MFTNPWVCSYIPGPKESFSLTYHPLGLNSCALAFTLDFCSSTGMIAAIPWMGLSTSRNVFSPSLRYSFVFSFSNRFHTAKTIHAAFQIVVFNEAHVPDLYVSMLLSPFIGRNKRREHAYMPLTPPIVYEGLDEAKSFFDICVIVERANGDFGCTTSENQVESGV